MDVTGHVIENPNREPDTYAKSIIDAFRQNGVSLSPEERAMLIVSSADEPEKENT